MRRFVASLTFTAVTAASLLAFAGTAGAQEGPPPASDTRAEYFEKNITHKSCSDLWEGSNFVFGEENPPKKTFIDITEEDVPEGIKLVGVVVKGGDGYNKYSADKLGAMPWEKLHAPYPKGNTKDFADISHWFACGVEVDEEEPTEPSEPTEPEEPTSSTSPSSTTNAPAGSTTTPKPAGAVSPSDGSELPDTGADVGWMIFLGAALLLSGGLLLGVPRIRNAVLRRN
ncbi:LPXTG cell wall anchor domain-containing protein [Actinokineospora sp.]|uniref:LPXTG cell wall anchor domain-containing protein n=1 Tax=Actinokineospora sp. TaxID=1872133 RepID=UPI003D6AAF1B